MTARQTVTIITQCLDENDFTVLKASIKKFHSSTATLTFTPQTRISNNGREFIAKNEARFNGNEYFSWHLTERRGKIRSLRDLHVKRVNIHVHLPLIGPLEDEAQQPVDKKIGRWLVPISKIAAICKNSFPNLDYKQSTFVIHLQHNHHYSFKQTIKDALKESFNPDIDGQNFICEPIDI